MAFSYTIPPAILAAYRKRVVPAPVGKKPMQAPVKPKRKLVPPKNASAPWSDPLIQQTADERVDAQLQPLQDASTARTKAQLAAIAGAGKAAAEMLAGSPERINSIYAQAAEEMKSLGTGFTGALRDRLGADQAAGAAFSASQGQAAPGGPDPNAISDTLYQGGVNIPGSSLVSQGANEASMAQSQVGAVALKSQADARAISQAGEQELLDLANKRPELRSQILDELYQREAAKATARYQSGQLAIQTKAQNLYEAQFGEKVRHDVAEERNATARVKLANKNYNLQVKKHNFAVDQAAQEGRTIDASASKAAGHLVANDGSPILDNHGNKIPVAAGASGSGNKGLTPSQRKTNTRMAGAAALTLYNDAHPHVDQYGIQQPPKHKMTFAQAQNYLMSTYGLNRSQARQKLVAAGWKPDGKRKTQFTG